MKRTIAPFAEDGRIKVAQIVGDAALGGVSACILNYYRHMDRGRYRFDFITYAPSPFDEQVREVDPASQIFYIPRLDKAFYKSVPALRRLLQEGGYSVVHSNMNTLSAFALRAAKQAGSPVRICHAHSAFDKHSDHYLSKAILRPFAARDATMLLACSRHAAENTYRKRADEAVILPNAIDLTHFSQARPAEAEGLHGKVALFVGRFAPQKNLFFLLDAFALARKTREMTLVLVGGGGQKEELAAYARARGIEEDVRFVPACDPAPWYARAAVFCLPSLYEGLGMVAIEAQAADLPCLLSEAVPHETDVTGTSRYLPLQTEAWAKALAEDSPRPQGGAETLRAAGYDIRSEAQRLSELYDAALSSLGDTPNV